MTGSASKHNPETGHDLADAPDALAGPAPVAVFCHDRPIHLRLTLEALARAQGFDRHPVHLFVDGLSPRGDRLGRDQLDGLVDRFAHDHPNVAVTRRPTNRVFANITDGVSEMCRRYGRVIVIEDDIVIAPDFLRYCREALDRYAEDDRVFAISGQMYQADLPPDPQVFFLPQVLIWGWATWARAWRHFDLAVPGWERIVGDPALRERFDLGGMRFSQMLRDSMAGRLHGFDVQWSANAFLRDGLTLVPYRPLTWNTGIGGGSHGIGGGASVDHRIGFIHGRESREDFAQPRLRWPIAWPDEAVVHEANRQRLAHRLRHVWRPHRRAYRLLRQWAQRLTR